MKLSAEVVTELALLKAEISDKKKKEKDLVDELKKLMEAEKLEEYAPKHSPYKLVLQSYERTSVEWKEEWKKLAKKLFGDKWKSKQDDIAEESKVPVTSLNVEPNERYVA
jgi:hypothetical protein